VQSDSHHVRNEPCPKCRELGKDRSGNNLGVYSDGHCYCWSCGYYVPPTGAAKIQEAIRVANPVIAKSIGLPEDVEFKLPEVAWKWLQQYSLSKGDIIRHKLMWSESWKRLIFPYFDTTGLLAWQGRYFGDDPKKGKWFSQGDLKSILHICGPAKGDTLVLVEDTVSAIKVGHHVPCMPIFGSHVSVRTLVRVRRFYGKIIIWLDKDKQIDSVKFSNNARLLGITSTSIITEKDPKEYPHDQLKAILAGAD
jgi:hypothetical protein